MNLLCFFILLACSLASVEAFVRSSWPVDRADQLAIRFALMEPPQHINEKPTTSSSSSRISKFLSKKKKTPRKPQRIETIEEYKKVVVDEPDQIVAVRFYSPVCKSCQAAEKYFHKLCRENPNVKFVELPTSKDNGYLHEGLGVKTFPFGHIYHPEAGLVEELKINKKVFGEFERVLQYYVDGQGEVDYNEEGLCEPAGCRIDYD